jgi:hypothetical protein
MHLDELCNLAPWYCLELFLWQAKASSRWQRRVPYLPTTWLTRFQQNYCDTTVQSQRHASLHMQMYTNLQEERGRCTTCCSSCAEQVLGPARGPCLRSRQNPATDYCAYISWSTTASRAYRCCILLHARYYILSSKEKSYYSVGHRVSAAQLNLIAIAQKQYMPLRGPDTQSTVHKQVQ